MIEDQSMCNGWDSQTVNELLLEVILLFREIF